MSAPRRRLAVMVTALLVTGAVRAQTPDWRPYPQTQPLTFGSLRLEPAFAGSPPEGEWWVSVALTEFNLWDRSFHTVQTHRDRNLARQPVTPEELRSIERNFRDDPAWHLDVAGWRTDLILSRGLPGGQSLTLQIPWIDIGSPRWDALGEAIHGTFHFASQRNLFPRGQTFLYLKDVDNRTIVQGGDELAGSGWGDITLGYGVPLAKWKEVHQRLELTVQAPTGKAGTLQGSGGWDGGLSWFALWRRPALAVRVAAGAMWLDGRGTFLGVERARATLHLMTEFEHHLAGRFSGVAGVRIDTSPLRPIIHGDPGGAPIFYRFGILRSAGKGWMAFEISDAVTPLRGVEADWAFQLSFGTVRPGSR